MVHKKNLTSILLMATSFVGGITAGFLLAPKTGKQSRLWLTNRTDNLANWIEDRSKTVRLKSNREFRKIRSNVKQGIDQNVPDLYSATEHIALSKDDLTSE